MTGPLKRGHLSCQTAIFFCLVKCLEMSSVDFEMDLDKSSNVLGVRDVIIVVGEATSPTLTSA